jgi:hypothetical protein
MKNNKEREGDNLSENGLKELIKTIKSKGKEWKIALVPSHYFKKKINSAKEHTELFEKAFKCDEAIRYDNINKYKYSEILQKARSSKYMYMAPHPSKVPVLLNKELKTLNHKLASASNNNNKIKCVREFVAAVIKIHPWVDFNLRTLQCFEFGVLMREGILPSVKYAPLRICNYTATEIIEEYRKDRITTENLIKNSSDGPKYDNTNRMVGCGTKIDFYQPEEVRYCGIFDAYSIYNKDKIYKIILSPFMKALEKLASKNPVSQPESIDHTCKKKNICSCCFPGLKRKGYTRI